MEVETAGKREGRRIRWERGAGGTGIRSETHSGPLQSEAEAAAAGLGMEKGRLSALGKLPCRQRACTEKLSPSTCRGQVVEAWVLKTRKQCRVLQLASLLGLTGGPLGAFSASRREGANPVGVQHD